MGDVFQYWLFDIIGLIIKVMCPPSIEWFKSPLTVDTVEGTTLQEKP
jgi:hypothetical protein